ncbi:hypothetical protein [Humibacillus xanthopallidus]|uniref:hypothetical protein n=1 Tax=Humibacillus xanthopallidus TaxID=412689 RepID=UPI0038516B78
MIAAAAALALLAAYPASASSRKSTYISWHTNGTPAIRADLSVTWLDNDEVNDMDLTVRDYKCDDRGGYATLSLQIRTGFGDTGNTGTIGSRLNSGGCGSTVTQRDRSYGTSWYTADVSQIYSAKLTLCINGGSCYYQFIDNPYNDDPASSNG